MKGNRENTPLVALIPVLQTPGTVNGPNIDTSKHDVADFHLNVGTAVATSTIDVKLQESADDGAGAPAGYADVSGGAFAQILAAATPTHKHMSVNLRGRKKWLRLVSVVGTANATLGASCILSAGKYKVPSPGSLPTPDVEVGF